MAPYVAPVTAAKHGIRLKVFEYPEDERDLVLLRQRPVVECYWS